MEILFEKLQFENKKLIDSISQTKNEWYKLNASKVENKRLKEQIEFFKKYF